MHYLRKLELYTQLTVKEYIYDETLFEIWKMLTFLKWMKYKASSNCFTILLISPKLNLTFVLDNNPAKSCSQNSNTKKKWERYRLLAVAVERQISIKFTTFLCFIRCKMRISRNAVIGNWKNK